MTMPPQNDLEERDQSGDRHRSLISQNGLPESVIGSLFYEQGRLRADLDRLINAPAVKPQATPKDSPERAKNGDAKEGAQGESKDEGKEAHKEPFIKRVTGWTKAHPMTTIAIPILLVALVVGGWFLWGYLQSYESTDDAQVDGHVNAISSRISGTVTAIYVEHNQSVDRGKLAVELDPRDYEVALSQQEANLAQAKANLYAQNPNVPITQLTQRTGVSSAGLDVTSARAGYLAQQQQVESALADLKQAEANAANSAAEEIRYRVLAG